MPRTVRMERVVRSFGYSVRRRLETWTAEGHLGGGGRSVQEVELDAGEVHGLAGLSVRLADHARSLPDA